MQALLVQNNALQAGVDDEVNRTILNLKLNHQALGHGITAGQISFRRIRVEDQMTGAEINGEVVQLEEVHADDGVCLAGEIGIAGQIANKHSYIGCSNGTELNLRNGSGFPLEISVKVETLSRVRIQLQFLGNSLPDNADGGASVQDEPQMRVISDAAFHLDKVPGRKPEWQLAARRVFGKPRLVVCWQRGGKEKAQTDQRKEPPIHGVRLGRGGGEDELPACKERPQFAGSLFVLSSLSACNARTALDLGSTSSGDLWGTRAPISQVLGVAMGNSIQRPIARFEDFEVNPETGEVWKAGRPLKVQDQPFKVLAALLERPGQIVTREELRQLIWADKSFGDFDHAINLALAKLRATLGDSADVPHLIETLPRRGYRFIAPLKEQINPPAARIIAPPQEQTVPSPVTEHPATAAGRKLWLIVGALALVVVAAVALLRMFSTRKESSTGGEILPLVSMPGQQDAPAISPDGSQVAFAYSGAPHPGIYVALIGGEKPLQLTQGDDDGNPAWSPDGRQIAFARFNESSGQKKLYVIPALGGSERHVYTTSFPNWAPCNQMSWSPDGKSLIFPEALDNSTKARLSILSLSDSTARPLTSPVNQQFDCDPVFSPDGATVAFARGPMGAFLSDLFVQKVDGGQPMRLTTGNSGGNAAWTQDGKEIVFDSSARGFEGLWRISASGGTPLPIAASGDAYEPSISRRGNQLAYQVFKQWDTVWRLDLKDERHALAPPMRLLSGRGIIWKPSYSPDGKKIAFESNRMGYVDVWMCDSDGSNCSQLTDRHGTSSTGRWSPNGRSLAFESITQNYWQVGVLELPDGTPHMLTTFPDTNNGAPSWSRDGKWLYFYSGHDPGGFQLWKIPVDGGSPVRVTSKGGVHGVESMDGRFLFYSKLHECGIWKRSLETGEESRLPVSSCCWYTWDVTRDGIYFLNVDIQPHGRIEFFDFAHGQNTPILALDKPASLFGGLAVSPDGKSLIFGLNELNESYIMVMKNFR